MTFQTRISRRFGNVANGAALFGDGFKPADVRASPVCHGEPLLTVIGAFKEGGMVRVASRRFRNDAMAGNAAGLDRQLHMRAVSEVRQQARVVHCPPSLPVNRQLAGVRMAVDTFWAIDQFTSAARGPLMGGPLGQTGILFASPALGQFGAPLSNQASAAFGGSLGYQLFFDSIIGQQVVFEVGGRKDTNGINQGEIGSAVRYQKRLNGHWILLVDGFASWRENEGVGPGARIEMFAKF